MSIENTNTVKKEGRFGHNDSVASFFGVLCIFAGVFALFFNFLISAVLIPFGLVLLILGELYLVKKEQQIQKKILLDIQQEVRDDLQRIKDIIGVKE